MITALAPMYARHTGNVYVTRSRQAWLRRNRDRILSLHWLHNPDMDIRHVVRDAQMTRNAPEKILQDKVIHLAKMNGYMVQHSRPVKQADGRWLTAIQGDAGFPDLVLAHRERGVLMVELKSDTGRLTAGQTAWRHNLTPHVEYWLVREADLPMLARRLGTPIR